MRLVVVHNPKSSRHRQVEREVLARLPQPYATYEVDTKLDVAANAAKLAKRLQASDRLISAGGDGTAAICLNAILQANLAITTEFAILPYGNFNDLARTFGRPTLATLISKTPKTTKAYPLELIVNSQHQRYALGYFTIGMFATATHIFDSTKIRQRLRHNHRNILYSILQLAKWYFKHRRDEFFPPEFILNGQKIINATDYVAVNAASMAGVMRSRPTIRSIQTFRSQTGNLSNLWGLLKIMLPSVLAKIPSQPTQSDTIEFATLTTLEIQGEGEYLTLHNVRQVQIQKSAQPLTIIVGQNTKLRRTGEGK
ncbi:MAG: hypothetical protein LBM12_01505 [Candidatus Nomurabacteria bacterium]|jgi:hypothetical protein|nr:hypothetical protein [Candidatus Nomurabacteria bacterium]